VSTELSSEARRLIQAAHGFDDASGADRDRLRERIATRLATGGGASLTSEKGWLTRRFGSHAGGSHMGAKALGLVAATGAAVAVIASWPSTKSLAPGEAIVVASPSAITSAATGSGRSPEVEVTPAPPQPLVREPEPGAAAPVLEAPSVPSHARPALAHARKAPRATTKAPSAEASSSQLEQELKLLSAARDGLKSGNTALAMERVQEHERRFPAGILAMEARALGVDALCAAGRHEAAREAAEAFLKRWPESPLAARVRSACL
jgi:TolA-binding protein